MAKNEEKTYNYIKIRQQTTKIKDKKCSKHIDITLKRNTH